MYVQQKIICTTKYLVNYNMLDNPIVLIWIVVYSRGSFKRGIQNAAVLQKGYSGCQLCYLRSIRMGHDYMQSCFLFKDIKCHIHPHKHLCHMTITERDSLCGSGLSACKNYPSRYSANPLAMQWLAAGHARTPQV